jgi:hypothetical protein
VTATCPCPHQLSLKDCSCREGFAYREAEAAKRPKARRRYVASRGWLNRPLGGSTPKTNPEHWAERGREWRDHLEQVSEVDPLLEEAVEDLRRLGLEVVVNELDGRALTRCPVPEHGEDRPFMDLSTQDGKVAVCCRGLKRWVQGPDGNPRRKTVRRGCSLEKIKAALEELRMQKDDEPLEGPHLLLKGSRTGDWLEEQKFAPVRWVVEGLLSEGPGLLIGSPKAGKSWIAVDLALAAANGDEAFGKLSVNRARPVFLLALEDSDRRLQDRMRRLRPDKPIPKLLTYMTELHGSAPDTIRAWLGTLPKKAKPLVILDTLGAAGMPQEKRGESAYQRDYRMMGEYKALCRERPGTTILILHHDRKAQADDFVQSISGTNGIGGGVDTILVVTRRRTSVQGLLKVTSRDAVEGEYAVGFFGEDGPGWILTGDDLEEASQESDSVYLGDRSSRVLRFINDNPDGVGPTKVSEACQIPYEEVGMYLKRLVESGRARKAGRGLYKPVSYVSPVSFPNNPTNTPNRGRGSRASARNAHEGDAGERATREEARATRAQARKRTKQKFATPETEDENLEEL